jgi:ELWxxDGT repeat protein
VTSHHRQLTAGFETLEGRCLLAGFARLVADINPIAIQSGSLSGFTRMGESIYFWASSVEGRTGLWTTDGTPHGTREVSNKSGFSLTEEDGMLYFRGTGYSDVWRSDGTHAGTVLVNHLEPEPYQPGGGFCDDCGTTPYGDLFVAGDMFFLTKRPHYGSWPLLGSDGTPAGRQSLGSYTGWEYFPDFTPVGDLLYFYGAKNGQNGLWRSDGRAAGTYLVHSYDPAVVPGVTEYNGAAFFLARNPTDPNRMGLWRSDGTTAGTVMISDVGPVGESGGEMAVVHGALYFSTADTSQGREAHRLVEHRHRRTEADAICRQ